MTAWRETAFAAGAALEVLAAKAALDGATPLACGLHLASAAAIAAGPGRALVQGRSGWALGFVLALVLPGCGGVGLWVASRIGDRATRGGGPALVRTPIPGPESALLAARQPPSERPGIPSHRDPVAALRRALQHPDEDMRLVAHAILESKSREAYRAVHEADCALRAAPEKGRAAHHLRLAAQHFELVRLDLAEGDCRDAALKQARAHARAAVERAPDLRAAHLLLGRAAIASGEAEEAEQALRRAVELGLPHAVARPYLAEAAFLRGGLDEVRRQLAAVPSPSSPPVERMRRYWA